MTRMYGRLVVCSTCNYVHTPITTGPLAVAVRRGTKKRADLAPGAVRPAHDKKQMLDTAHEEIVAGVEEI